MNGGVHRNDDIFSKSVRLPRKDFAVQALAASDITKYTIYMKSFTKELWFNTSKEREFINITPTVERLLAESGIREGLVLANAMHITASVFINDDESSLHHDHWSNTPCVRAW